MLQPNQPVDNTWHMMMLPGHEPAPLTAADEEFKPEGCSAFATLDELTASASRCNAGLHLSAGCAGRNYTLQYNGVMRITALRKCCA